MYSWIGPVPDTAISAGFETLAGQHIRTQLRARAHAPEQHPLVPQDQPSDGCLVAINIRPETGQHHPDRIEELRVRVVVVDEPRDQIDRVHRCVVPIEIRAEQIRWVKQIPARQQHHLRARTNDRVHLPNRRDLEPARERALLTFGTLG